MEQEGLLLFRFRDTGHTKLTAIAKIEPEFHPSGWSEGFPKRGPE
jgi:hypothetical protein